MKRNFFKKTTPLVTIARRTNALRIPRKRIAALVRYLLRAEAANVDEVEIAVVDGPEIRDLNRRYHHVRAVTDVLSFNLSNPGESTFAQIIVCAAEAIRQSQRRRHGPQHELLLYIAHGLLHLLGYDDTTPSKARQMSKRQEELLARFVKRQR